MEYDPNSYIRIFIAWVVKRKIVSYNNVQILESANYPFKKCRMSKRRKLKICIF